MMKFFSCGFFLGLFSWSVVASAGVPCEMEYVWEAQGYRDPFKGRTFPSTSDPADQAACLKWCKDQLKEIPKGYAPGLVTSVKLLSCKSGSKALTASNVEWTDYCWSSTYGGISVGYKTTNYNQAKFTKSQCLAACKGADQCKFGADFLFNNPVTLEKVEKQVCWSSTYDGPSKGYKTWNSSPTLYTKAECEAKCKVNGANQCKFGTDILFDKPIDNVGVTGTSGAGTDFCWTQVLVTGKGYQTWNSSPQKMTKDQCSAKCKATAGAQRQCKFGVNSIQ